MSSYYRRKRSGFDFGDFAVTKREILASVSIIAIMMLIGVLIASRISEHQMDKNEIYNKAVKIQSQELFRYGMDTSVGNAFVYGDLKAVDTVTYPEIGGEYMYVKKVKEKYTMHTRRVKSGKTYVTETYWTWDYAGKEDVKCKEISFLGITFNSNKIELPDTDFIDTIKESSHIRYKYYGTEVKYTGTVFTQLKDKSITDNSSFYKDMNIEKTIKYLESGIGVVIFWILWVLLTGGCIFGFYYIDNNWLE